MRPRKAVIVPTRHIVPGLMRDPLASLEDLTVRLEGEIARLSLGPFRPYLITRPEHVQHVLHENVGNYRREGMMWKPLSRLTGCPGWRRRAANGALTYCEVPTCSTANPI